MEKNSLLINKQEIKLGILIGKKLWLNMKPLILVSKNSYFFYLIITILE